MRNLKKHNIKKKGIRTVIKELKHRLHTKTAKLKRYEERVNQCKINRMFFQNQKRVYQQIDGIRNINNEKPNAEESKQFWSNVWYNEKEHERNTEWLREFRAQKGNMKRHDINVTTEMIKEQVKKIPNWKSPGPDGVQGYWLKKLTALHEHIAKQMDNIISNRDCIPKWTTLGKTVLCQKDPSKGNAVDNYRPTSCLPLIWKLMTGTVAESIYNFLDVNDKLSVEQKGCTKESRGTKDQLLIDKTILRDCRKRHTSLGMAWIGYKKAYDMVPHSWILESLELEQVSDNILEFVKRSMANWQTELTSCRESLAKVNIRRGILQGDSLSPLLFVICMIPLTHVLRKAKARYTLGGGEKINHLLFMDDLKLYGKSENEIKGLVSTVEVFSQDIGMEFGIKKCGVNYEWRNYYE